MAGSSAERARTGGALLLTRSVARHSCRARATQWRRPRRRARCISTSSPIPCAPGAGSVRARMSAPQLPCGALRRCRADASRAPRLRRAQASGTCARAASRAARRPRPARERARADARRVLRSAHGPRADAPPLPPQRPCAGLAAAARCGGRHAALAALPAGAARHVGVLGRGCAHARRRQNRLLRQALRQGRLEGARSSADGAGAGAQQHRWRALLRSCARG